MMRPALVVETLSDSFRDAWTELASELDLSLTVSGPGAGVVDAGRSILLLAAGGAEDAVVEAARRASAQGAPFAAVVADADYRLATNVLRAGADQIFMLPRDLDLLRSWLKEQAEALLARGRQRTFSEGEASKFRFDGIFGSSAALVQALERAARVIPHGSVTVLLMGETGTGKELFARAIHYNGPRREGPFVDINCAALPEQLLESELFGHEKGAFTGATVAKPGLFEVANGGTIFLDEIGHLALPLQGKLLRALQERTVRPLGGTRTVAVDVRVIAATHVELAGAVQRKEFREDLYYRLNVLPITLPPLRERREDIVPLARHFLAQFAREYGIDSPTLGPGAESALRERDWPGNIRELRNAVERAVLLGGGTLDRPDFVLERPAPGSGAEPVRLNDIISDAVQEALDALGGNKSAAARRLGISRTRLQRILDGDQESDTLNGRRDPVEDAP